MVMWDNELYHYGIPRKSGRYKWGSGKNPYRHEKTSKRPKPTSEDLDKMIRFADPKDLYANFEHLTDEQVMRAVNRAGNKKKLQDLDPSSIANGRSKVDVYLDRSAKVVDMFSKSLGSADRILAIDKKVSGGKRIGNR